MEYCSKCKMPKLERGLDRCYCEPSIDNTMEDEIATRTREQLAETIGSPFRHWLAPISDPSELKNTVIDPTSLPLSVFCTGDSRVYENTGTGWTFIDDDGFRQDLVLAISPYIGATLVMGNIRIGIIESIKADRSTCPIYEMDKGPEQTCVPAKMTYVIRLSKNDSL